MKKAFVIILSVLLFISIFVSCDSDNIIDEMFGFVVTFNANGGTGTMEPQRFTTEGGKLNPNTFTKTDYVFSKWNTSADGTGTDYADGDNIKSSSDITLYAQWKLASIVLTPDTTDWVDGKSYTIENDLTITERVTITGNVTLVLPDGKTLTTSQGISVGEGSTLSIISSGIEGTGKLIATGGGGSAAIGGMNESGKKNAGTIIIDGVNVEARGGEGGAGIGGAYQGSGGNITISGEDTLVTATAGSGSGVEGIGKGESGSASGTLTIGEGQGLYGGPNKDNMVFLSGPTESYAGVRTPYMEATATEFVTVSFNANGGSGTMAAQSVRSGVDTTLDANEFTHDTLTFGGWALTSGGEAVYSDQGTINVSDDTTLYATWIDVIYLSSDMTTLEGGKKYSIEDNLNIPNRLSIDGTEAATIVLPAGKTLTLEKGINVESGKSLIIDGSGSLISTAEEGSGDAGIGGACDASGGTITIKGGTITAIGASKSKAGGAGIGGGIGGGGSVIISGGVVTATGGSGTTDGGSGIGSGTYGEQGEITISGGTITATGGLKAAGIGGGGGRAIVNSITISGGNVTAIGGSDASGIGVGPLIADSVVISITGGTVTATSGGENASGIGGGQGSGNVTIAIGAGLGLYGGADKDHADFLSAPTESYTGARPVYMETKATTYVTVTFNANGGSGTMAAQSVRSGVDATLNDNTFEKGTYGFAGWSLTSSGDIAYANQATINITADTTLYARWRDTTISFNKNDEDASGNMDNLYVYSGELVTLPVNAFTKDDNGFIGWALKADEDPVYSDGATISVDKNTELFAKWTSLTYLEDLVGTTLTGGNTYSIKDNLSFTDNRLSISSGGDVMILLPANTTLTLGKGINVPVGTTLTIIGTGSLTATADSSNAAIGSNNHGSFGTIIIEGGIITASGGYDSAGIGTGHDGHGGTINIRGGNITSTGGYNGAGIGHGNNSNGVSVTISGGTVNAIGGGNRSGINAASVTVEGGTVTTQGWSPSEAGISGTLVIAEGVGLFDGGNYLLSGPTESYSGNRPQIMNLRAAEFVTISFNANGGEGTMPDQVAASGYASKLNENLFTKEDLYFGGWALSATGDIEYENKGNITVNADIALYAKWVDAIPISSSTSSLEGGKKYTILANVTNNNRLSINGADAVIIDLPAEKTLTLPNGISVPDGKSLIIRGEGTLTVSVQHDPYGETSYYAGIGGNRGQTAGTITIEGGTVNATGGKWGGAGIGGGGGEARGQSYKGGDGGTITILGGTVNATGGAGGAGIGGGRYAIEGGTISIEGGSVTSQGGSGAAAIGGGACGCNGGYITISGTDTIVDATGGSDAGAGIGGGKEEGAGGTIIISGGTVTARGGQSAYTSGGGAAGIGGGSGTASYEGGAGGTITISGGDVTAIGNKNAAGIGGGGSFSDTKGGAGGTVNITGGTVKATGGSGARGIGKGSGKNLATDGVLIIGDNVGLYGGSSQSDEKFLTKPTNSWPDDLDHRPIFMEAKPTDYVTVSFDGNGGEGEMTSQLMVKDFAFYDLSANAFTTPTEGLIFTGWATSKDGIVVYSDEGTIAFSEDVTLYAKWGTDVVITDSLKKLVAGHNHIHYGDVTNGNRLYISGGDSATITLTEGKTLNLSQGINVPQGKTLTINGNGTMNATGGTNQAGIGGGNKEYGGSIIINGGTITARGNGRAAGIGAGGASDGDYGYTAGELIVNGGNVTAYGGNGGGLAGAGGAGIGGGGGPSLTQPGAGGTVTINGGEVTAYGGSFAAGIGGGPATTGRTTIILTVNGGSVTATGNGAGAGIGGFKDYSGGIVTITGGSVTATGGVFSSDYIGMGIGKGSSGSDEGTLILDTVSMQVSDNGTSWSAYDGTNRHRYMKTN